eukprot:5761478-Prymnesium_polylepis.1
MVKSRCRSILDAKAPDAAAHSCREAPGAASGDKCRCAEADHHTRLRRQELVLDVPDKVRNEGVAADIESVLVEMPARQTVSELQRHGGVSSSVLRCRSLSGRGRSRCCIRYQLALCMRLGVEISDLAELPRPALCVCGAAHDAF